MPASRCSRIHSPIRRAISAGIVYYPLGAKLPGLQAELEADYKAALARAFGIVFNILFTITNQPIARFADDLRRHGQWDGYLEMLANSFNPTTVEGLRK